MPRRTHRVGGSGQESGRSNRGGAPGVLHSQASAAKPCQNACPLSICTRPSAAAAGGGGGAAAAARKPHRFRHARISASHLALFECLTPGPLWQAWHCCPARDQKVPAFDRAAHPKAALCTAGPRDNADLQFYSRGGRETLAGGGADGTAGGMRALPCAPLRGCQPLCDPREASDDHGQGHPAGATHSGCLRIVAMT